jgi:hypothetical protein
MTNKTSGLCWSELRTRMASQPGRSRAWTDVGLWSLRALEAHLGPAWPASADAKGGAEGLVQACIVGHVVAYADQVELAVRLELLSQVSGFAKVRKTMRQDPRAEQLLHARIQLELATLASKAGCAPILEPPPTCHPADVAFSWREREVVVEAKAVLTSDGWLEERKATDALFEQIRSIERCYGVTCEGEMPDTGNHQDSEKLIAHVEAYARLVAAGGSAPAIRTSRGALRLRRSGPGSRAALTGPQMRDDAWARVRSRIAEKPRLRWRLALPGFA